MKKILSIILLIFLMLPIQSFGELNSEEKSVFNFENNRCTNLSEEDIPTIFIPGILASWYVQENYKKNVIKRWIPDPVTHSYDTLFNTFRQNGYSLRDVYYTDQFNIYIDNSVDSKQSLYLFGYDWKKDNKITATILSKLVWEIRKNYKKHNGCDPGNVNIIGHSMGGLVARAYLEDICASENDINNYYNNVVIGEIKNIKSAKCPYYSKINKLITISTPHRGSPKSLGMWEKGQLERFNGYIVSKALKGELQVAGDDNLYKSFHGYNEKIENGIITVGQLLPDIQNDNFYNRNNLAYFEKEGVEIPLSSYPKNSFLEELNKKSNITKSLDRVESFNSYYSTVTGNYENNNVVGFKLSDTKNIDSVYYDETEKSEGNDIYDKYKSTDYILKNNYNDILRNSEGLGGDGTVPTFNLMLVPNDSDNGKQIENEKFKSIEIKCYDSTKILKYGYNNLRDIENNLYVNFGSDNFLGGDTLLEGCGHSKTPILGAVKVFNKIIGKEFEGKDEEKVFKERKLLLSYLGYASYRNLNKMGREGLISSGSNYYDKFGGIRNAYEMDKVFENNYINSFGSGNIDVYLDDNNKDDKKIDIDFGGGLGDLIRYEVLSPINIIIEDEQGRRIGIDPETGMIINEIPGAWTSGDTEGSGEPEFFLIPNTGTGEIKHNIKTYGTGEGEYHITMEKINLDPVENTGTGSVESSTGKLLVISGYATENMGETYDIKQKGKEYKVEMIEEKVDRVKELKKEKEQNNNSNIEKKVVSYSSGYSYGSSSRYKLNKLKRLKKGNNIKKIELEKNELKVKKIRKMTRNEYIQNLDKKYSKKLEKIKEIIHKKISQKKRDKFKQLLISKKDDYLSKIIDEYKKIKAEYLIKKIIEIL